MKISNTPIRIGTKTVKNRVTFAPTVKFDWTDRTGIAIERFARHYEARAAGGTGLVVVEATCISPDGRLAPSQLGLWEDGQIPGHTAITEACHKYGTVMLVQLHHGGYNTHHECGPSKGPSAVDWPYYGKTVTTEAMTKDDIVFLRGEFIEAAVRAKKAGYDGVQLHGCHGYLINEFVSPAANRRDDEYGGSLINRARFGCEIIGGVREGVRRRLYHIRPDHGRRADDCRGVRRGGTNTSGPAPTTSRRRAVSHPPGQRRWAALGVSPLTASSGPARNCASTWPAGSLSPWCAASSRRSWRTSSSTRGWRIRSTRPGRCWPIRTGRMPSLVTPLMSSAATAKAASGAPLCPIAALRWPNGTGRTRVVLITAGNMTGKALPKIADLRLFKTNGGPTPGLSGEILKPAELFYFRPLVACFV